ncbi:pyrroline-5-carboxylate reductase [Legionella jamestowniensis]|uniref:Pyrroline-5-carboxylate reductase n=1 Tax=Legionella jamestowniensis TaxID=455 RepID=A0A0W0UKY7_9GAMM|nr:pyrroline-5-carboxylate reductase [Legionella jamestowniensis]KTD08563.1 pyrroline-5-carboxylate reductase [Legionella jamestowniensis]OCH96985.1 pyrroline-5-carboxylate reductase [Legionella jamestowniensis]SFL52885.1 pyrroline-5-carboxylate reductase [Legionella jamestowniensis DSM 19215]
MKISFIGFGNMAQAIAKGLVANKRYHILAAAPSLSNGMDEEGIITSSSNLEIIRNAEVIILAVKPDKAEIVLQEIGPSLPVHSLLISIAAGVKLHSLEKHCRKGQAIIRCMPNLAISIGKGATPLIANSNSNSQHKQWATELFENLALIHWTTNENDLNAFTALSGSGPAYVFLLMEAMIEAAKKLGLDEEVARAFTLQTVNGALGLAENNNNISRLRQQVTSPGGTTAAALEILQTHNFQKLIHEAMDAAAKRAEMLSS